jgi:hypothetical protein
MQVGALQQDATILDLIRQQSSQEGQGAVQNDQNAVTQLDQQQQDSNRDTARLTIDTMESSSEKHSRQLIDIMA